MSINKIWIQAHNNIYQNVCILYFFKNTSRIDRLGLLLSEFISFSILLFFGFSKRGFSFNSMFLIYSSFYDKCYYCNAIFLFNNSIYLEFAGKFSIFYLYFYCDLAGYRLLFCMDKLLDGFWLFLSSYICCVNLCTSFWC